MHLSYDFTSGSDIAPRIKIYKRPVIYIVKLHYEMRAIMKLCVYAKVLEFSFKNYSKTSKI